MNTKRILFFILFLNLIVHLQAQELMRTAGIFGDNMILQRNTNTAIWGWDQPDQEIVVEINGKTATTTVSEDGEWMVCLPALKAGGTYTMEIRGSTVISFENILVGDVWLASGQSNMEWTLGSGVVNRDAEISAADFPEIRQIRVPRALGYTPKNNIESAEWQVCSPETAPGFSAVAYFFAKDLYEKYRIPIGIINSSWGGTAAEAWTSREMLKTLPDFRGRLLLDEASAENWEAFLVENENNEALKYEILYHSENGIKAGVINRNYNDKNWPETNVPAWKERLAGVIYLRKSVNIPGNIAGKELELHLGRVNQRDETYFNGEKVGGLHGVDIREYKVEGKLVRAGKNVIAIRLTEPWANYPNMYGPAEVMVIKSTTGEWSESLAGSWKYKQGLEPEVPVIKRYQDSLASIYNGMIAPIIPYSLTGAVWYQGESNAGRAYQYRDLFKALITDWRVRWDAGYFPFLFVQLANYTKAQAEPGPSDWAELREAQLMALDLPNTGMAVTIDIGEAEDIHPKNKQDVGKRLALAAGKLVYREEDLVYSGPVYQSMKIKGDRIILSFDHVGGGLVTAGEDLSGFSIAGDDMKFHWAKARITGDQVEVWNEEVKKPVAVRYAWANNPKCNLYNKEGLPATSFRTDDWQGITFNKK